MGKKTTQEDAGRTALGSDDVSRPCLVLGSRGQVGYHQFHRLFLLMFGRNAADLVGDLIALYRDVFSFDIRNVYKDIWASISRRYEAMTFRTGEGFTHSLIHRSFRSSYSCGKGSGPSSWEWAGYEVSHRRWRAVSYSSGPW